MAQDSTTADNFSSSPIETTLKLFTIDPSFCKIDYACKSVVAEPANANSKVPTCDDIVFDNVFDENGTDG